MKPNPEVIKIREESLREKYHKAIWVFIKLDDEQTIKSKFGTYKIEGRDLIGNEKKYKYVYVIIKGKSGKPIAFISNEMEDITNRVRLL